MIDMHSHFLPFLDDGADSLETALSMLKMAKLNGADTVVATPHCILKSVCVNDFLKKRQESFEAVISAVANNPREYPKLLCGAEVFLGYDIAEIEGIEKLCYGDSNYILLELGTSVSPAVISEWIYNISIKNLRPVIAHIDRHPLYREIMDELSGIEVVYQLNAARFLGMFSAGAVKDILRRHDKFVAGSDMHNLTTRQFNLHEAKKKAQIIAPNYCEMLFDKGAESILNNDNFFSLC